MIWSLFGVMLATAVVWPVDHHYCGGDLRSVSFLGKAPSCHTIAKKSCCSKGKKVKICLSDNTGECKKGCCENEMQLIDFEEEMTLIWSEHDNTRSSISFSEHLFHVTSIDENSVYLNARIPDKKPPDRSFIQVWRL